MNKDECEILLVEDNPDDARLTLRALVKDNLIQNTFLVNTGEDALDFLSATGQYSNRITEPLPKIILLDLSLPKMDGIEFLRKLRANKKLKGISVIAVTSSQDTQGIHECYLLGVKNFIQKPVKSENLVEAVLQTGVILSVRLMNTYTKWLKNFLKTKKQKVV